MADFELGKYGSEGGVLTRMKVVEGSSIILVLHYLINNEVGSLLELLSWMNNQFHAY